MSVGRVVGTLEEAGTDEEDDVVSPSKIVGINVGTEEGFEVRMANTGILVRPEGDWVKCKVSTGNEDGLFEGSKLSSNKVGILVGMFEGEYTVSGKL